jgi:hypothetical protein
MLSRFYRDAANNIVPTCTAYGGQWWTPMFPEDVENGWALVKILCNGHQIDAARQDDHVIVCPLEYDPRPLDKRIIDAYSSWPGVDSDMNMGALLATLTDKEPVFGR